MNNVSGGGEGVAYFLSEALWPDHIVEESLDLAADERYYWDYYYLTGEMY